jgi:hypothetical protein
MAHRKMGFFIGCYNTPMKRLLFLAEMGFVATLWWQTRFDILTWLPGWAVMDNSIDYLVPFIYLSDVLFGLVMAVSITGFVVRITGNKGEERRLEHMGWGNWGRMREALDIQTLYGPGFWFGLLMIAGLISIVINGVGIGGWYRWFKLLEGGLVAFWVVKRWGDRGRRNWYVGVLLAGLGLESLVMLGEWLDQSSLGWQWIGEWSFGVGTPGIAKVILGGQNYLRPMGTFAHANIVAAVLVVALPLAWWWKGNMEYGIWSAVFGWRINPTMEGSLRRIVNWGWVVLTVAAIGVSFSRSAWVVGVGIGLWLVVGWWIDRSLQSETRNLGSLRKSMRLKVLGLGALGGLGVLVGPVAVSRFGSLATTDSWSASLRLRLMGIAWQMWLSHPWGVGMNNFTVALARNQSLYKMNWWQPVHNVWLLVLAETGWLGLVGLLGLLATTVWWLFVALWRERGKSLVAVLVLAGVWLAIIALSMIDHYWWTSQQAFLAIWGIGGGTWLLKRKIYDSKTHI